MRKLIVIFIVLGLFASCKKDVNENNIITTIEDLQVNENFNWQTSRNITISISQAIEGMLIISSEDESMLFYKAFYDGSESNISVKISVPSYLNRIKVNSQVIALSGNTMNITNIKKTKSANVINYSLYLNGTTDWVGIPNSGNLSFVNALTMEAWVKTERQQTAKIIQKGDWDGFGIGQDLWKGWMVSIVMNNLDAESVYWESGQPVLNKWYHIVATYNGSIIKLYVDGVLKNSKNITGTMNHTNRTVSIGSDNGQQKFFKGYIDNLSLWNRAITQSEVLQGVNSVWTGSENGLLAFWNCNEGSGSILNNSTSALLKGNLTGSFSLDTGYGNDNDGDGISNGYDDYPNDPLRAFNNYYPSNGFGTLAFEDLWPSKGDYDFNDLIVDYHFCNVTNHNNKLVETFATFIVKATGASYKNGFGFQFAGNTIPQTAISSTGHKLTENYINLGTNGLENNQNKPTFIVFDNAYKCIPYPGNGNGVNTDNNTPYVTPDTIVLQISYTAGLYSLSDLNIAGFNPFMIINKIRGKEVHLIDFPNTQLANTSLFATMDDASNQGLNKYYRSNKNLPWALNFYEKFDYPIEKAEILKAYLHFADWVQSDGNLYPDWFQNKADNKNSSYIYQH
jgi:LruC domain-containing protein